MCRCCARGVGLIKIIAIIDNNIGAGGGFNQALNAIMQMKRLSINRFNFEVFTASKENVFFLKNFGVCASGVQITIFDRMLVMLSQNKLWQFIQRRLKIIGPLEKKLSQHGCDVVYFVTPSRLCACLQKLNYINTVWDLCHRDTPEFPEVREFNEFVIRENNYKYNFGAALVTLTDSFRLADMAARFYGIDKQRFIAMPFEPTPFLMENQQVGVGGVLDKRKLETGYLYYPAQFWPHKNHIRILQALIILRDEQAWSPTVVFSGKDYGNLVHIKNFISENSLESQIRILGFVPPEDIRGLYENAMVVVMPTYFGPTNLPPLEAWLLNVPLIYSSHLAEQAGNAALLVDPDSATELATALQLCRKPEVREQLVRAGHQRLAEISQQRASAEDSLCSVLEKFAVRRQCWE